MFSPNCRSSSPHSKVHYWTRLDFEVLESRRVLASSSFSGGVLTVLGTGGNETINVSRTTSGIIKVNGANVNVHGAALKVSQTKSIVVDGRAGNDTITINDANGRMPKATLKGSAGNDTLVGSAAADKLLGGFGNDTLLGRGGNDQVFGESGLDSLVWNAGDGSDLLEGGADADTLQILGSAAADILSLSANVDRVLLSHNLSSFLNINDVETLGLGVAGGNDTVTVNDLTGTDLTTVNVDLGVNGLGDAGVDSVIVNATSAADVEQAAAVNGTVQVTGLAAQVNITQSEAANDTLTINGLGGTDTLSGSVGLAALVKLTLDGGDGSDTLNGGNGADTLIGGNGNDTIDGNGGNDTAFMGSGNDTFVWDPGDGSDVVEGQDGFDTLLFNGAPGAEIFAASSNGGRLLFTRNVGNIVMDTDDIENLTLNALGGIDTVTINDLAPTDVTNVNFNLGVNGAGDTAADAVTVKGTVGVDVMSISGSGGSVTLTSVTTTIAFVNAEPANDTLTVNTSGGDDLVSASALANSSVRLTINGGADDDILVGSDGNDTINGDAG